MQSRGRRSVLMPSRGLACAKCGRLPAPSCICALCTARHCPPLYTHGPGPRPNQYPDATRLRSQPLSASCRSECLALPGASHPRPSARGFHPGARHRCTPCCARSPGILALYMITQTMTHVLEQLVPLYSAGIVIYRRFCRVPRCFHKYSVTCQHLNTCAHLNPPHTPRPPHTVLPRFRRPIDP